jgi:hypothetical protein
MCTVKVFLSWSGTQSRALAEQLRAWLPAVLQAVEPWMSTEDIDKGARWSSDIAVELQQAKVGIICVTRRNLNEPWIHFEAGALSKALDQSFVIPYLLDVKPSDLKGPLVQFQAAAADEHDTLKLVHSINRALGIDALAEANVDRFFRKWWPELAAALNLIPGIEPSSEIVRTERDLLEETLELLRNLTRDSKSQPTAVKVHVFTPNDPRGKIVRNGLDIDERGILQRLHIRYPDRDEIWDVPYDESQPSTREMYRRPTGAPVPSSAPSQERERSS